MSCLRVAVLLLLCAPLNANAWTYSPGITVSELTQTHGFAHLESSGNRSLAISGSQIAITWEDNHSGKPEVYIAFKANAAVKFSAAVRVSEAGPAYEPAVAGVGDGRFLVVWEANDRVWARLVSAQHTGAIQALSSQPAREVTVTRGPAGAVWLAWATKADGHFQIVATRAALQGDEIRLAEVRPVDAQAPKQDQLYPTIAVTAAGCVLGWEDRRYGHTRLFTAFAPSGKWFGPIRQLNELKAQRSNVYGNGTGAMRVVLASDGQQRVVASWLDKRDFAEGYDVYAALSTDGGRQFQANEKVIDALGANQPQWHAVSAMDSQGHSVVAWDDQRDGSPDVWWSVRQGTQWSDNDSPAGANGEGSQTNPAMTFDAAGHLHLAFLIRNDGRSSIRYFVATPSSTEFGNGP
jgi:hypothetical protein